MNDLSQLFRIEENHANYLVNFSTRFSYIYVEAPKVACSTIKKILQLGEVDGDATRLSEDVHKRSASPLPTIRQHPADFWRLCDDPATFRFCFVRNPFSRALSCYLDKFVQNEEARPIYLPRLGLKTDKIISFHTFLSAIREQTNAERNLHWAPQSYILSPRRFGYSFIGRFEHLETDIARLTARLGFSQFAETRIAPHATSASEKIKAHYGPKEIALVQDIYQRDFKTFGYGWSPDIL